MKKFIIIISILFISFNCYAQSIQLSKNENNEWILKTTFQKLMKNKTWEEIQIQNNSTIILNNISCSVRVKGREHKMKNISQIKPGYNETFNGYVDNEMKDEFPQYFGKEGKFLSNNYNTITFIINFNEYKNAVKITDVRMDDKDLLFIIDDDTNYKTEIEKQNPETSDAKIVTIEGKKYLLYEGIAYPVNE